MTFSSPLNKRGVTPAKAMVAAISGYAMDGFDLLILGFMLPQSAFRWRSALLRPVPSLPGR
jgi:hypothetical protein